MKKIMLFIGIVSVTFAGNVDNQGKLLFMKNGCYGCHGVDAKGDKNYPSLAGKPKEYIKNKLLIYKEGKINSNRSNIMKPFAQVLSKKEIETLADYLSKLDKNKRTPYFYHDYEVGDSAGS